MNWPDDVVVPVAADAAPADQARVAAWSALFPPGALATRIAILGEALARLDVPLQGRAAEPVLRSMALGTIVEVSLRLLNLPVSESELAELDALAVALRVAQGLTERRGRANSDAAAGIRALAADLLARHSDWAEIADEWQTAMHVYTNQTDEQRTWDRATIELVADAQPLHLVMRAAGMRTGDPVSWHAALSRMYAGLSWITHDVGTAAQSDPSVKVVGPVADLLSATTAQAASADRRFKDSLVVMEDRAKGLDTAMRQMRAAPAEIDEYVRTTLRFAGLTFAALEAHGLA
jgi:hypothetical protein